MKHFVPIWLLILMVLVAACDKTTTTTSSVAKVTSFRLSNNTCAGVAAIQFQIEEGLDVGHIYNIDSLPFGAPIDSLRPYFTFYTTPGSAVLYMPDTVVSLTGTDTLSWRNGPDTLVVTSSDGNTIKRYRMDINWHRADPDLYRWTRVCENVYHESISATQQLFALPSGVLSLYTNDGLHTRLFESTNGGVNWQEKTVSGLPADCRVRSIIRLEDEATFFYAQDTLIYHSEDGANFEAYPIPADGYRYLTMLFVFPDESGVEHPWLFVHNTTDDTYHLAFFEHKVTGELVLIRQISPANFPIDGFSAVRFASASERQRMMVFGGFDTDGHMVNSRWNWEYSSAVGTRITDYSIETPTYPRAANSSIIWYDNRLLMFGAVDSTYQYLGSKVYYSEDEGMNWNQMDTTKCMLPVEEYSERMNVAAAVFNGDIYVVGGSNNTTTFSDVFRGRLNSIDWPMRH